MKELTFHRLLLQAVEQRGDRLAFIQDDTEEDLAHHAARSLQIVNALQDLKIERGDRLMIVAGASRYVINVMHAAALGGWIAVPVNPALTEHELAHALADAAPSVMFVDPPRLAGVLDAQRKVGLNARIFVIGEPEGASQPDEIGTFSGLIDGASTKVPDEPEESTPLCMLYTGGTTGRPKGAICDNRQLLLACHRMLKIMAVGDDSTLLSVNPLFHLAAMPAVYYFALDAQAVIVRTTLIPEQVFADAARHHVTHMGVVVPILQRLIQHPSFDPSDFGTLRSLTYGGSPMPVDVLARIRQLWPHVALQQSYGLTEAFSPVTTLSDADHRLGDHLLGSIGRATPGTKLTIRDDDGTEVPQGQHGEICIESGSVATHYWGDPASEADPPYLRTGDAGWLDENGYLFLLDRLKDMIKTGGENVYSIEVERALQRHPDVEAVAVIGLPDDQWGERVHAVVVVRSGATVTEGQLREFAGTWLAGFKIPKTMDVQDEPLPVSALGKILKHRLRQRIGEKA